MAAPWLGAATLLREPKGRLLPETPPDRSPSPFCVTICHLSVKSLGLSVAAKPIKPLFTQGLDDLVVCPNNRADSLRIGFTIAAPILGDLALVVLVPGIAAWIGPDSMTQ